MSKDRTLFYKKQIEYFSKDTTSHKYRKYIKWLRVVEEQKEVACPSCGSTGYTKIRYGLIREPKIDEIYGGCAHDNVYSPDYYCRHCKISFA